MTTESGHLKIREQDEPIKEAPLTSEELLVEAKYAEWTGMYVDFFTDTFVEEARREISIILDRNNIRGTGSHSPKTVPYLPRPLLTEIATVLCKVEQKRRANWEDGTLVA